MPAPPRPSPPLPPSAPDPAVVAAVVAADATADAAVMESPTFASHPCEWELVQILGRWIQGRTEPWIHEADVYSDDPLSLTARFKPATAAKDGSPAWYFICTPRKKPGNDVRISRTAGSGFWKEERSYEVNGIRDVKVGYKQTFSFLVKSKKEGKLRLGWILHSFKMAEGNDPRHLYKVFPSPRPVHDEEALRAIIALSATPPAAAATAKGAAPRVGSEAAAAAAAVEIAGLGWPKAAAMQKDPPPPAAAATTTTATTTTATTTSATSVPPPAAATATPRSRAATTSRAKAVAAARAVADARAAAAAAAVKIAVLGWPKAAAMQKDPPPQPAAAATSAPPAAAVAATTRQAAAAMQKDPPPPPPAAAAAAAVTATSAPAAAAAAVTATSAPAAEEAESPKKWMKVLLSDSPVQSSHRPKRVYQMIDLSEQGVADISVKKTKLMTGWLTIEQ